MCEAIGGGATAQLATQQGALGSMTQTSTGAATQVAGATGGGAIPTAATGVGGDLSSIIAQVQQAVTSLQTFVGGAMGGGAIGGGALPLGAQPAAPTPPVEGGGMPGMQMPGQTPGQSPTQTAPGKHDHAAGGGHAEGGKHAKGHHGMHTVERDDPVNKAKAQKYLDAVSSFFGDTKRSEVTFKAGSKQTHGKLTDAQRTAFEKKFPGLEAPAAVVFPPKGKGDTPIGVVFNKSKGDFDLGMGSMHKHSAKGNAMQHVWFTPNDLAFAFSDQEGGGAKAAQKRIQGGGAPGK